jgi:hypothetical protein
MFFIDDEHMDRLLAALQKTGAIKPDGRIDSYYGASLYLLTGLKYAWPRLQKYVCSGYIDFKPMLQSGLSSGEAIIVRMAGNFYNGGFWDGTTPFDIVSTLDEEHRELALTAMILRPMRLTIDAIRKSQRYLSA